MACSLLLVHIYAHPGWLPAVYSPVFIPDSADKADYHGYNRKYRPSIHLHLKFLPRMCFLLLIVNDIRNFVFGLAEATVYGFCKSLKQKFIMPFTIILAYVHFGFQFTALFLTYF